ncbi:MAG: hypothetical protein J5J06_14440 [Phycisphaerae bacterium]|nr:hypothetical protein [Phycisphaerae bacterium]
MKKMVTRCLIVAMLFGSSFIVGCQCGQEAHPEMLTGQQQQVEHERHAKGISSHSAD